MKQICTEVSCEFFQAYKWCKAPSCLRKKRRWDTCGCPYICNNKNDYGYCKTTGCINPKRQLRTFTSYDPIEIARQYAPKFDKPVVDMVEVVRCKDCHWYYEKGAFCDYWADLYEHAEAQPVHSPIDFCSRGERRENADSDTNTDDI